MKTDANLNGLELSPKNAELHHGCSPVVHGHADRDQAVFVAPQDEVVATDEFCSGDLANNEPLQQEIRSFPQDTPLERLVIDTVEEFEALGERWRQFEPDPMNGFAWNISWWKAFQSQGQLRLLALVSQGKMVGIAPLYVDRWFGLKRLRLLATGATCTDYADLICDPQHYQSCALSVAEYIREQKFPVVELECTREDRLTIFIKENLGDLYQSDHRNVEPSWILKLPETMEAFTANAKSSLRRKINKANRRLGSGEFTVKTSSSGDLDIALAFEILKDLHTRRWHSMNGPGVFGDEKFGAFLEAAVLKFHQTQQCEVIVLYQDDQPIAAQLYFISSKGYQMYQSGYNPEAMKLEPGHILFTSMVGRAIERGETQFDFLRGDEPYKEYWGADALPQTKLRLIANKPFPRLVAKVIEMVRRIRRGA